MFKTYLRMLAFIQPVTKYAVPYFGYALLHAAFNTFNYAMLIPILNTMFGDDYSFEPTYDLPERISPSSFSHFTSYIYTAFFGETYHVQKMLVLLASITILMTLLSNTFRYLCSVTVESMRAQSLRNMRNKLFDHVMQMSVGYFSESRKGDIMARISNDTNMVQVCITNTLQVLFREPFLVVGYLVAMFAISWQLTLFAIIFLPVVAVLIGSVVKKLRSPATRSMELNSELITTMDESFAGVKVIKSYNATNYVTEKYHELTDLVSKFTLSMARRQQLASPMSEVMGITAIGVIIVYGGSLVAQGDFDAAQFMAFIAIFSQITRPMRSFIEQFATINHGVAAGERVLKLVDSPCDLKDKEDAKPLLGFHDCIEFRNVTFSYDGKRDVLKNVSFTVKKGETVALVGPSGGGKSTISELVPRYYDPQKGEVLIDGVSLKDLTQESIRNCMGTVAQDTILFNDTILANLAFGKQDATKEEVVEAAKIANAHNFIMEKQKGYETNIGDRGMKLSGGQRQRLSISRAVLKNPEILILDEATSALDTESEKLVQEALMNLLEGRTSIVIAHRLSTIHNADKILVIDQGEIAEQGTHSELLAKGGIYAKLVEMQSFEK
ncbi:MAG: ABC transporter ATP-binding protein [Rikenellaceae bacterium]